MAEYFFMLCATPELCKPGTWFGLNELLDLNAASDSRYGCDRNRNLRKNQKALDLGDAGAHAAGGGKISSHYLAKAVFYDPLGWIVRATLHFTKQDLEIEVYVLIREITANLVSFFRSNRTCTNDSPKPTL